MVSLSVFELRQYRLQPGTRDRFIAHFDEHLVAPQQAAGMRLIGRFRDRDRPDMFVWIRGFADMEQRARALESFYFGPVWREHREVMNSMMIDSDDVLLLRPLDPAVGPFAAAPGAGGVRVRVWETGVDHVDAPVAGYREHIAPRLRDAGERILAELRTETAMNTFPRLPVREDIVALVAITAISSPDRPHLDGPAPSQVVTLDPT